MIAGLLEKASCNILGPLRNKFIDTLSIVLELKRKAQETTNITKCQDYVSQTNPVGATIMYDAIYVQNRYTVHLVCKYTLMKSQFAGDT